MKRSFSRSSSKVRPVFAIGFVALAVGFWQTTASAEPQTAWDQAHVTTIARDLAKAADKLYNAQIEAPQNMGEANMDEGFVGELDQLRSEAVRLSESLAKGKVEADTRENVERIKELNDDLNEEEERMEMEESITSQFSDIENLVGQLLPYYDLKNEE